jgi:hypothetical protein
LDLHATLGWLSSEEGPWEHIDAGLLLDPAPGIRLRNSSQPVDIRSEKVHSDDPEGSERAPDPGIHIVHPVATVSIPDDFHIDQPFDAQMSGKLPAGLRQLGIVEPEQLAGRTSASRSADCLARGNGAHPTSVDDTTDLQTAPIDMALEEVGVTVPSFGKRAFEILERADDRETHTSTSHAGLVHDRKPEDFDHLTGSRHRCRDHIGGEETSGLQST